MKQGEIRGNGNGQIPGFRFATSGLPCYATNNLSCDNSWSLPCRHWNLKCNGYLCESTRVFHLQLKSFSRNRLLVFFSDKHGLTINYFYIKLTLRLIWSSLVTGWNTFTGQYIHSVYTIFFASY
jgi:hypothetical protein